VNANATVEGIAENLASYYLLYGDVNLINTEIDFTTLLQEKRSEKLLKSILNPNQRLILDYVPSTKVQN
jgi:zinc protease